MRLAEYEIQAIKNTVRHYDTTTQVYLFGSRTDDSKKGGDMDLIILSNKITKDDLALLEWNLFNSIEERKIDILLSLFKIKDEFINIVIKKSIPLC